MLMVLVALLSGCGWLTSKEAERWLNGRTCAGEAEETGAKGCEDYYEDYDGDGWGGADSVCLCAANQVYTTLNPGDCNDTVKAINPDALEICDAAEVDNDCDDSTRDEKTIWFYDGDQDQHGASESAELCGSEEPYTAPAPDDCDDDDPNIPGAVELCDGIDTDCDPETPEDRKITLDGQNFATIQEAIDAAAENATIYICAGSYAGNLVVDKSLTLFGREGADETILDAGGLGTVLTITGGDVTVEGLTLRNGTGTAVGDAGRGGGAFVLGDASLSVTDGVLTGNHVTGEGGAIYTMGPLRLSNTFVYDNFANGRGGAIFADTTASTLVLEDSSIFYNQANTGAGLYVHGVELNLGDSLIAGNFGDFGGALAIFGATDVHGGTLSSNSASGYGGGIYVNAEGETIALDGVRVEDNISLGPGGGVAVLAGTLFSDASSWADPDTECSYSNYPTDVYTAAERVCASNDATFTCTSDGCVGEVYDDCACGG